MITHDKIAEQSIISSLSTDKSSESGNSWKDVRLYFVINIMFACGNFQVYHIYVANNAQKSITSWINKTSIAEDLEDTGVHGLWTLVLVMFFVGAAISSFAFAWFADSLGRRSVFYMVVFIQILAIGFSINCFYDYSYFSLILQRLCVGVAYGLGNSVSILYCLEVVHRSQRGFYMAISIAHLHLSSVIATTLTLPQFLGTEDLWQYSFIIGSAPAALLLVCLPFIPESPRFAYSKNQNIDQCRAILDWLHDADEVKSSLAEIQNEHELYRKSSNSTNGVCLKDFLTRADLREATQVSVWMVFLLSFGGLYVYNTMSTLIFQDAGLEHEDAAEATVLLMASKTLPVVILVFLSDVIGRRRLLFIGCTLCIVGQIGLIILEFDFGASEAVAYTTVGSLIVWAYGSRCVHTVVHTVPGELFPQDARAKGTAITWTSMLLFQGLSIGVYSVCMNMFNLYITNVIFMISNPILLYYGYRNLPETAGKSFSDIHAELLKKSGEKTRLVAKK